MCNNVIKSLFFTMKKYLLAIDSFKGCMTTFEIEEIIRETILSFEPESKVVCVPLSDGGEGMLSIIQKLGGFSIVECNCHDALMRRIKAQYGVGRDGTAIIESALTCGINLLSDTTLCPVKATTYGVGEMLADAIKRGCNNILIGLGGSATSDCGIGMLQALIDIFATNKTIFEVKAFFKTNFPKLMITIACDVNNILFGDNGAAYVFGPQKGAKKEDIFILDRKAKTFSTIASNIMGIDCSMCPGAGAAGGLGYAFMQFFNANVVSGTDIIMELTSLKQKIKDSDIVITGEGKADKQTLQGKAPYGILNAAKLYKKPVVLVAGQIKDKKLLRDAGFDYLLELNSNIPSSDSNNVQQKYLDIDYNRKVISNKLPIFLSKLTF